MGDCTLLAHDGSTVTIVRLAPAVWEVRLSDQPVLVIDHPTTWGWVARTRVTSNHPWETVREAIASTHPEFAETEWAVAVAAHFDVDAAV